MAGTPQARRRRRVALVAVAAAVAVAALAFLLTPGGRARPERIGSPAGALDPPRDLPAADAEIATADAAAPAPAAGIPVLCYHYFRPAFSPGYTARVLGAVVLNLPTLGTREYWTTPIGEFERHLRLLRERGVHVLTLPELQAAAREGRTIPRPAVVLTIDDADASVYTLAWPLLRRYGYRAHLFVPTAQVGQRWNGLRICSWAQLREMSDSGAILVDSHTNDLHYKLNTNEGWQPIFLRPDLLAGRHGPDGPAVGSRADAADLLAGVVPSPRLRAALGSPYGAVARDLLTSRRAIAAGVGRPPAYLAWPYGFASTALDSAAAAVGFTGTVSLKPRPWRASGSAWHVGRYAITAKMTPALLLETLPDFAPTVAGTRP